MDKNKKDRTELPLGLGMALAQNVPAMEFFSKLSQADKQLIIEKTRSIQSKEQMWAFVQRMAETGTPE